ncbi:MAG: hypothetical protein V1866_05100 [archaeon]
MSTEAIVSAVIRPPLSPALLVQLVNQALPGQAENYFIVGHKLIRDECDEEIMIDKWTAPIDTAIAVEIMAPLKDSSIPPISKSQFMEVDGCSYELYFGDAFSHSHYQWWASPPEGWEPLADVVEMLTGCAGIYP